MRRYQRRCSVSETDILIDRARKPYRPQDNQLPNIEGAIASKLYTSLLPLFLKGRIKHLENAADNNLLALAFALRAYRLERGAYPQTLAQLAPDYLPTIPDDPFATKGSYPYQTLPNDRYLLYSIGPDGIDNKGKPVDDPIVGIIPPESDISGVATNHIGDIVVGVNNN